MFQPADRTFFDWWDTCWNTGDKGFGDVVFPVFLARPPYWD